MLTVRIVKNHRLPEGSKRLVWQSLPMFRILNGYRLGVATDDAVDRMLAAAVGELTETEVAAWIAERLQPLKSAYANCAARSRAPSTALDGALRRSSLGTERGKE